MPDTMEMLLQAAPFSVEKAEKERLLGLHLHKLTRFHAEHCAPYRAMLRALGYAEEGFQGDIASIPYIPVRLFKELALKSVPEEELIRTVSSSGTTGQRVSKIYLDKETASAQQKALIRIVSAMIGSERMPMLILDTPSVLKNRAMFSARGAGILGFSIFSRDRFYALDDEMRLDLAGVQAFLEKHQGERLLLFGFTFMIWQYFYEELLRLREQGIVLDLSNAVLVHGGGWKKLVDKRVSPKEFHDRLQEACGLSQIHDYYGMAEQTGSIYMQCEYGHFHASIFSDVLIRDPMRFSVLPPGERGILETVSALPRSYPGHALLTEDAGCLLGEDDCPCGRKGKYFTVEGRLKNAEIRGCSDTFSLA